MKNYELLAAKISIFVIYFWFGILKLLGVSPATPLVATLFEKTISFMPFSVFYSFFAIFEMIIGVLFLIRGMERPAIYLISAHLIIVALPLFLLPDITWQLFLIPTLEGQYIIKNIAIAALAILISRKTI
ncbi:MAG: hypothetical protein AAB847_01270 [Patescibacteria group bacterium]